MSEVVEVYVHMGGLEGGKVSGNEELVLESLLPIPATAEVGKRDGGEDERP